MKVVLRSDVDNVGKKGDICDVADGFARNFLVPRGKAIVASKGIEAQAASMRKSREQVEARDRTDAEAQAQKLQGVTLQVSGKAGDEGKLFGSISSTDIASAIAKQTGLTVDKRKVVTDHIKEVGNHTVQVKLHSDVVVDLPVEVTAQ